MKGSCNQLKNESLLQFLELLRKHALWSYPDGVQQHAFTFRQLFDFIDKVQLDSLKNTLGNYLQH